MKSKILSYKEDLKLIESILKKLKKNNKRIALAHGVYESSSLWSCFLIFKMLNKSVMF